MSEEESGEPRESRVRRRYLTGGGAQIVAVAVGVGVMILMLGLTAVAELVLFRHPSGAR